MGVVLPHVRGISKMGEMNFIFFGQQSGRGKLMRGWVGVLRKLWIGNNIFVSCNPTYPIF